MLPFSLKARYTLYITIAIGMFVMAIGARAWKAHTNDEELNFIVSDARGHYVYLPSIVLDGDVDLLNQMLATFGDDLRRIDYDLHRRTPTGVVGNKYPIGMALTLFPSFLVAHGVALVGQRFTDSAWFVPDGYSLIYQLFSLALILGLSCCTMILLDALIAQHFRVDERAIAAGVLAFWLGSHYAWYCFREPFMVHVVSVFWVTAVVYLCARLRRDAFAGRVKWSTVTMLALATSMALVTRATNIFVAPFLAWMAVGVYRAGLIGRLLRLLPAALPGLIPLVAQACVWRAMYGNWLHYSYGEEGFVWTQPALLQTLFSLHKGLFVWTPLLLLAVIGIWWHLGAPRTPHKGLVTCWLVAAGILWYLNSAWWAWGFGWSFGARAFLELAGLFVVGLALTFEFAKRQTHFTRGILVTATVALMVFNYALMGLYQTNRINRGDWENGGWTREGAPQRFLNHIEQVRQTRLDPQD